MKKNYINFIFLLAASLIVITSCNQTDEIKSVAKPTSLPIIYEKRMQDSYVYGQGQATLQNDLPDTIAIVQDTILGFADGYGGKTGRDFSVIKKSDVIGGFPDLSAIGGYSINYEKFNLGNYKVSTGANVVIAGAIPNPGPTDLAGTYKRTSNGVLIVLKKVFSGVYVIDNPGGAGVPPFPYLFYNYDNGSGGDKLVFPIQINPCGGGLQLVGPTAPFSLASKEYTASYPPIISATSPLTLQWRVYEFPAANANSAHTGAALCQWGTGVRTFEKQ